MFNMKEILEEIMNILLMMIITTVIGIAILKVLGIL